MITLEWTGVSTDPQDGARLPDNAPRFILPHWQHTYVIAIADALATAAENSPLRAALNRARDARNTAPLAISREAHIHAEACATEWQHSPGRVLAHVAHTAARDAEHLTADDYRIARNVLQAVRRQRIERESAERRAAYDRHRRHGQASPAAPDLTPDADRP